MYDFLWFPIGTLAGVAVCAFFGMRATKKEATCPAEVLRQAPDADALASMRIVDITSTNNSYDPMGTVLSELDMEGVKVILGGTLCADMEGYMK